MRTVLATVLLLATALAGCGAPEFTWPDPQPHACGDAADAQLTCTTIWDGFEQPVHVAHAGDASGRLFVAEQTGRIWILEGGEISKRPYLDLQDRVATCHLEQGLLGFAFSPDFEDDGGVFVTYTEKKSCSKRGTYDKGDLLLWRFQDDGGYIDRTSGELLLRMPEPYRNHNGGYITFGPDEMLYVSVGDGGDHGDPLNTGQDPTDLLGSILRLDVLSGPGYYIPDDNPYAHSDSGRAEVWMHGLRNPWRFTFDDRDDSIWVADVGQACYEEVNHLPRSEAGGANLGWSDREGPARYTGDGCPPVEADSYNRVDPVWWYEHDDAGKCSVTGGPVITDASLPALDNAYLAGDFCTGTLWAIRSVNGTYEASHAMDTGLQITGMGLDEDGALYLLHWGGSLHRIESS